MKCKCEWTRQVTTRTVVKLTFSLQLPLQPPMVALGMVQVTHAAPQITDQDRTSPAMLNRLTWICNCVSTRTKSGWTVLTSTLDPPREPTARQASAKQLKMRGKPLTSNSQQNVTQRVFRPQLRTKAITRSSSSNSRISKPSWTVLRKLMLTFWMVQTFRRSSSNKYWWFLTIRLSSKLAQRVAIRHALLQIITILAAIMAQLTDRKKQIISSKFVGFC